MLILGSGDLILRPLQGDDADQIASLINSRKILDNLRDYIPYPYYKKDAHRFIRLTSKQVPPCTFGIIYKNELCGVIGLVMQSDIYRLSAEVGYWIGEPFWGKGIATQALQLITNYGFDQLKLNRIFAGTFSHNKASGRVLEKCGFQKEGVAKQAIIKNDQILDEHRYAILASDHSK